MKNNYLKHVMYSLFFISFIAIVSCVLMQDKQVNRTTQSVPQVEESDFYTKEVQPIFNNRCIACHSCLESPCQLNLQSYEGLKRGGIQGSLVYHGSRRDEAKLTRLYEDAQTVDQWRKMGFYDVIGSAQSSILLQSLKLGQGKRVLPEDEVSKNQICAKDMNSFYDKNADMKLAMPYGLPPISVDNNKTIAEWVGMGAPAPKDEDGVIPIEFVKSKEAWENFLNKRDIKTQLVSRYLYEHLFLADFYLESQPHYFMKMIRSSTACDSGPKIIATRRPNDSPGVEQWFYCFVKSRGVAVDKTHIPYNFSLNKLDWIKKNFMQIEWQPLEQKLDFAPEVASNPFKSFKSIPVSARYKFLLEDSFYHINTFIKGPVCNGTNAVNSIQEQFYTFFMNPESDLMALSDEYSKQVVDQLALPGQWGSLVEIPQMFGDYRVLINERNQYRRTRGLQLQKFKPQGLTLADLWDGYGQNDNAVLTIIRHGGNARVIKGAFGDLSKTAFVLDYSLFERLVYNLVVNFDVYGNVGHQFLTRVYMDLIRMEAENNFLDFLPEGDRIKYKEQWYKGIVTTFKLNMFDEKQFSPIPAGVQFEKSGHSQLQLVRRFLFEHLNEKVRGPVDPINWKTLQSVPNKNEEQEQLAKIVSATDTAYAHRFPEISMLVVTENNVPKRTYSIIHNRQLKNVSWIMLESTRLDNKLSNLMVARGYYSSYPNQFIAVEARDLPNMVSAILAIKDQSNYDSFVDKYGVSRLDPRMWTLYDFMIDDFMKLDPINAGRLDLSRYQLN